ncbi:DeoR/GlpR family transcriptional regulator [Agarivorans sp. MS3-6]|uniref:DeoR/GlpR family transcriptional regulator n=1 Tax=Agarivorans sp. TSD2052 TaxID=2937286 RepID=UPI00200F7CFA|nr:DeoR/GlpR family transcriptional regulator [Agarivorans sp. TSD2052]UPW18943.1 DeoR/GlpR family transcriptional regulator [Agarivorans sp. TSD2052]
MKQTQRHQQILQVIKTQGFVATEELVETLNVSPQTIRRDLNVLAEQKLIHRHHGGASLLASSVVNDSYSNRKIKQHLEKESIALKIAEQIPNGASLFLDIGTTAETIARALLNHRDLRIITNNIHVAALLMVKDDFNVIMAGGALRNKDGGIVGEATIDFIKQFRLDYGVITVSGIDLEGSLLDFDYHEVRVTQAIIACSRNVILAADHSKFGRNAMINIGNIAQVDQLYTDKSVPQDIADILKREEVQLRLCPPALNGQSSEALTY